LENKKGLPMEKLFKPSTELRITREEMLYLMRTLDANNLIVVDRQILEKEMRSSLSKTDTEKIEKSLVAKNIIKCDGRQGYVVPTDIRPMLEALFFPEHAVFVVRDQKKGGLQVFCVVKKNNLLLLHSFPEEKKHALRTFSGPDELFQYMVYLFPIFHIPISRAKSEIPLIIYEQIQSLAESGETEKALRLLEKTSLDPDAKKQLIHAFSDKILGGTVSLISFLEGKAEQVDAIDVVSDGRTGWLISQEKPSTPEGVVLSVRRTGADLAMVIRRFIERLTGGNLPRQAADPSGKFKRFTMDSYELIMALSVINCVDLAMKMYTAMSGDVNHEFYNDRMKIAQKSLLMTGLCTVSPQGVPILNEDLAKAVFTIAKADWFIQITASGKDSAAETGVYITRGQFFSAYYNHGEHLQVIEYGMHKDAGLYIESLFPDFCTTKGDSELMTAISFGAMNRLKNKEGNRKEVEKILSADGLTQLLAQSLAEDYSDSIFRAKLLRNNPPEKKEDGREKEIEKEKGKKNGKPISMLLLFKSPRRSWMVHFPDLNEKGKASLADRESFRKALTNLLI
jgi:hypothetical protein